MSSINRSVFVLSRKFEHSIRLETKTTKIYSVEKVEIKDLCGAGDTFIAALCVNYLNSRNIDEAIEFANKCATQVVQKKGVNIVNEIQ